MFSQLLLAQFLVLLGQYGDDFKRIAASMPNKVRGFLIIHIQYLIRVPI